MTLSVYLKHIKKMEESIYKTVLDSITNGARFRIDFKSRTLVVNRKRIINNGVYDGNLGIEKTADIQSFLKEVERLYGWYKHSVPSERSAGKQHLYFKALPESELTDEDMLYGQGREINQFKLEMYILCQLIHGFVWDERKMGKWFWQSKQDKDLVILRDWLENSQLK